MSYDIGPGHNQPPEDEELAALFKRVDELVANANRWRAERPMIIDTEMAGAAQRFIEQLREVGAALKAAMKDMLEPIANAEALVRMQFREPLALVDLALDGVVKLNTDFLQRERDRLDEERRRQEQEAEAALVRAHDLAEAAKRPGATVEEQRAAILAEDKATDLAAKALSIPERPQIRDDQSSRAMSLHARWKARVIDETAALRAYAKHPDVRAAALAQVVKTATREARLQKDKTKAKPGIEYYVEERAT